MDPTASGPALAPVVARIRAGCARTGGKRTWIVALSGIDGSGKGFVAERLSELLVAAGLRAAPLSVDGWLHLPPVRFSTHEPGRHFYDHALRFDELFRDVVFPLRRHPSLTCVVDHVDERGDDYRPRPLTFTDLDVLLLEGIFLLKRPFRDGRYDLTLWLDCTFETALTRALARSQEGLPPAATAHAYHTIYFPAQQHHLRLDTPHLHADLRLPNDPALPAPPFDYPLQSTRP